MKWRVSFRTVGVIVLALAATRSWAIDGLSATIDRVRPSIIAIGIHDSLGSPALIYRGTGFVVGSGNLVATNAHVLPEALSEGQNLVAFAPGDGPEARPRSVTTVAIDPSHDLALVRIDGAPLPTLAMASSGTGTVRPGRPVAFTGFPLGNVLGLTPVTHRGIVSAVTPIAIPGATAQQLNEKTIRRLKSGSFSVFQLDATAYPGNSGSPLYDPDTGETIGVINMVFVKGSKESALSQPSGISFAVPIEHLLALMRAAR